MFSLRTALPEVPTFETERLRFRGHRPEDLTDCAALWADPVVVRYISGKPSTREEVWMRLLRYVGHWATLGFGNWAVFDKVSGRFVGEVGFVNYQRDVQPALDAPETGWVLAPWAHGQGFATEAVQGILAWGDANFPGQRTVCIIQPVNRASIRVAEKCGYRLMTEGKYRGQPTLLFERRPGQGG